MPCTFEERVCREYLQSSVGEAITSLLEYDELYDLFALVYSRVAIRGAMMDADLAARLEALEGYMQQQGDCAARIALLEGQTQQLHATQERFRGEFHQRVADQQQQIAEVLQGVNTLRDRLEAMVSAGIQRGETVPLSLPSKFSGASAEALRDFMQSLAIVFELRAEKFSTERQRIMFCASLLEGTALAWFRGVVEANPADPILSSWPQFVQAITVAFGNPQQKSLAQRKLRRCYQGSRSVAAYVADFQRLAADTGFNDEARVSEFKRGLSAQFLENIATRHPPPATLSEWISSAYSAESVLADLWDTVARANRRPTISEAKPKLLTASAPKPVTRVTPPPPPPPPPATKSEAEPMDMSLFKGGGFHLTKEEKRRRRAEGLCMYCGHAGHIAMHCPNKGTIALAEHVEQQPLVWQGEHNPCEPDPDEESDPEYEDQTWKEMYRGSRAYSGPAN